MIVLRIAGISGTAFSWFVTVLLSILLFVACDDGCPPCCEDNGTGDTENGSENGDLDVDPAEIVRLPAVLNEIDCHGRDWIELVNPGTETTDLSGWSLTDVLDDSEHIYTFAEGLSLKPGEYLVIKEEDEDEGESGLPFGIKCGGDTIYLMDNTGEIIDQAAVGDTTSGTTWGRYPDSTGSWRETLPSQGETNTVSEGEAAFLFDSTAVHEIDLTLPDASVQALENSPFEYVEATFTMKAFGVTYDTMTVGVRLKSGLSFKPLSEKAAFKIKFDEFDDDARFHGLKAMTLNNMTDDPSNLHETMAYSVFRAFDVPAPLSGYAWIRVNDEPYGLYLVLEKYDDIFLNRMFASTAHLYEGSVDLYSGQATQFEVDEGDAEDIEDLTALIQTINQTSDDQWMDTIATVANLEEMVRLWAVENFIGHEDGYSMASNNYYLHADASGYFHMLPWGTDRCFESFSLMPSGSSVIPTHCLNDAECAAIYASESAALKQLVSSMSWEESIDETVTAIESYVENDPRKTYTLEDFRTGVQSLKSYLQTRTETKR